MAMVKADACLEEQDEKLKCVHFFQVSPYWAHSEAILLALLSDEDPNMRKWAVQKIMHLRQKATDKDGVRVWKKVTLLFNPLPDHYRDMIGKKESIQLSTHIYRPSEHYYVLISLSFFSYRLGQRKYY